MEKWKNRRMLAGAVVLLLALATGGWALAARGDDLPEGVVLRYGDTSVSRTDLEARVEVLEALYGVRRPDGGAGAEFDRAAAKSAAVALVLEHDAEERGIEIADKLVADQLDRLVEQQLAGGRAEFTEFLTTAGLSRQDVLDEIERQMATAALVEQVTEDVPAPTTAQAREAYRENRERMATPETRTLRNIVVGSRADAVRVRRSVDRGESFTQLVSTWSRDQSTRSRGGSLGAVRRDQLEADYAEAAFGADQGEAFGPVRTQHGWNVGLVQRIQAARPLGFDAVEDQLLEELHGRDRLRVWRDHLARLLREADVRYAPRYRPEDPTAPPADVATPDAG